jgi:hypothetical protein
MWGEWSTCSRTCDSGTLTRSRSCDNPAPAHGGYDCPGNKNDTTQCNIQTCPGIYVMIQCFIFFLLLPYFHLHHLWIRIQFIARCIRYNIMWYITSAICGRSVVWIVQLHHAQVLISDASTLSCHTTLFSYMYPCVYMLIMTPTEQK